MQNEISINVHAHRNPHVNRNAHTHRNAQETRSYREVHNSYANQEIGGADDIRLVSSLPADVIQGNLICLVSYLKTQRAHDEQYYMEMLEKLGIHEMPESRPFEEIFRLVTPREMLNDLIAQNSRVVRHDVTMVEIMRNAKMAYFGQQDLMKHLTNPEIFINGGFWGRLEELRNIAATIDYSGMSDTEKVMSIYNRYDEAFGNFRCGGLFAGGNSNISDGLMRVNAQFQRELISVFGTAEKAQAAYRRALYGNMSSFEIRAEIASKYPPPGQMTLRDFNKMLREMQEVGAADGLYFAYGRAMENTAMCSFVKAELMDTPLDINWLVDGFNSIANCAVNHTRTRALGTGRVMEQLFGVQFDNRGNAFTNRRSPVDYASQSRIISSRHDNWTARDYENWLLAEFTKDYEERLAIHSEWLARMKAASEPIPMEVTLPSWL